jgi:hypothetical protein
VGAVTVPVTCGFAAEADMLAPLANAAAVIAGEPVTVLFEVASRAAGVPDLVLVKPAVDAAAERSGAMELTDVAALAVMLVLAEDSASPAGLAVEELARRVGVSAARLRQRVLPQMLDYGHVVRVDGVTWAPAYRRRSPVDLLITVEAKLRDWKRALTQASRHAAAADFSYVALDRVGAARAAGKVDNFSRFGVGLATVHDAATVTIDLAAAPRPVRTSLRRELLAEQTVQMIRRGRLSGEPPLVFGRRLLSTTGADPRLTSASAR